MSYRICHLGKYYPPARGGIETHVQSLAQAQAALGASVHVVCVNHANAKGEDVTWSRLAKTPRRDEQDGRVRVTRLPRRASLARWEYSPRIRRALGGLWRRPLDILHLHVPNPTMLLALATVRFRTPLVVSYHSDIVRQKLLMPVLRPFERIVFGKAARLFVASPAYASGSRCLRPYASKIALLPYGLDLRPHLRPSIEARRYAQQLRRQYGSPMWLCVGRLVYYKGLDVAIAALRQVPGWLLIVGVGPEEKTLRRQAARLGVSHRIAWLGTLGSQQLVGAYHAATALWFPSNARSEAFGLVQVEAMASGCPVINTNLRRSGVPWVSLHETTGLTIPTNDPIALAGATRRLLREPALRRELVQSGRKRAITQFNWSLMARHSLELYRDSTKPAPAAGRTTPAAAA